MNRGPWKKWTPAVAVSATIAALAAGGSIAASARTDLPDRTPQDVLEMVAAHEVEGFSGRLAASVELGLPQLPREAVRDAEAQDTGAVDARLAELLALVPGTHEARVFADGHDRSRLQLLDGAEEKNLIRNDDELWFYDSVEDRAVHATLAAGGAGHGEATDPWRGDGALPTPERIAERVLDRAEAHSTVTVEEGTADSGRDAYTVRLDPRTDETLVDSVLVDVDAQTGMPLGVEVRAVGQDEPAVSVAFTEFTPGAPDAGLFDFEPPAGATVEEQTLPDCGPWSGAAGAREDGNRGPVSGDRARGEVVGDGWETVVVMPAGSGRGELAGSEPLDELAVEVEGGRVLGTPLLNVLLTDDGRVLAGPVPQHRLLEVAGAGTGEE